MLISISLLSLLSLSLVWAGRKFKSGKLIQQIEGNYAVESSDRHVKLAELTCLSCYVLGAVCAVLMVILLVNNQHQLAAIFSLSMILTVPKVLFLIYGVFKLIYFH